jgi:gamma-glutamylcyclotransferase (GGCT)/AIG2-like uncharacterized protein YtfP
MTYRLFVYGSLRSGFRNPAYAYLTRYFKLEGEAVVKGRFYFNGKMPVAVPTTDEHYITGELYTIRETSDFEWAISQLDDYEGLNVMPGEKPSYCRKEVPVIINGKEVTAWIYWYNKDVEGMPEIETGEVLKYIIQQSHSNPS